MRILVACEFSGVVRDAFIRKGHEAVSCDLVDTEIPGPHIIGDVRKVLNFGWDMLIGFPPCTDLAVSGARWFKEKGVESRWKAIDFVSKLMFNDSINKICIENPVGKISTMIRKPDQIIQPWQFGHSVNKKTCLWLKNLPKLVPTKVMEYRFDKIHRMPPSKTRSQDRSRTFIGIANAMAEQWG